MESCRNAVHAGQRNHVIGTGKLPGNSKPQEERRANDGFSVGFFQRIEDEVGDRVSALGQFGTCPGNLGTSVSAEHFYHSR